MRFSDYVFRRIASVALVLEHFHPWRCGWSGATPGVVVPVLRTRGHGKEFAMTQPPRNPQDARLGLLDSARDRFRAGTPDHMAASPKLQQVRMYALDDVVVLEVAGRLSHVVEDLDRAIQLALSDGPRGVACDLSAVLEGAEPRAVEILATAGRHVADWPGIPVAVACRDAQVRAALKAHPLGGHLIVTKSALTAVAEILASPTPVVERIHLAPQQTAAPASRDFVTCTLLRWKLSSSIPCVCLVVSELVTSAALHAGTDIDVSLAWDMTALRLTVADRSSDLPHPQQYHFDRHHRGLTIVAGLSRAFGVLPSAPVGKVVWAVFDVPKPHASTRSRHLEPASATTESPMPTQPATPRQPGRPLPTAPIKDHHAFAQHGATHLALVTAPLHARPPTMEQVGESQSPPRGRYNDSSNYLG